MKVKKIISKMCKNRVTLKKNVYIYIYSVNKLSTL